MPLWLCSPFSRLDFTLGTQRKGWSSVLEDEVRYAPAAAGMGTGGPRGAYPGAPVTVTVPAAGSSAAERGHEMQWPQPCQLSQDPGNTP